MESTKPGLIVRACGHLCSGAGIQISQQNVALAERSCKRPNEKGPFILCISTGARQKDSPKGIGRLMKRFWILPLLAALYTAIAIAQDVVVINTGLSDRVYEEGVRHESPPVIVRPGTNRFVEVFDTRNHVDPNVCVDFGSERSLDGGKTWQDFSIGSGICGQSGGFKDKQGNPLSSAGGIISGEFAQSEINAAVRSGSEKVFRSRGRTPMRSPCQGGARHFALRPRSK